MELGSNLRMSEVSAAIGLVQLDHLDGWVARRNAIAQQYTNALEGHQFLNAPKVRPGAYHAWHQYCVQTTEPDRFVTHLDVLGIDARRYYTTPCHRQQVYCEHPQYNSTLVNTDKAANTLVAIPVMHALTETERNRIIEALLSFE